MRQQGFSLIELLVVIAIFSLLLGIATLQFNQYSTKTAMEAQVRGMYADIMEARSQALLQKKSRSFKLDATNTQFSVYATSDGSGAAIRQTSLKYPVETDNTDTISFDDRGVASGSKTICVKQAKNPAVIDSISIDGNGTMIVLGKRNGGACGSANFTAK